MEAVASFGTYYFSITNEELFNGSTSHIVKIDVPTGKNPIEYAISTNRVIFNAFFEYIINSGVASGEYAVLYNDLGIKNKKDADVADDLFDYYYEFIFNDAEIDTSSGFVELSEDYKKILTWLLRVIEKYKGKELIKLWRRGDYAPAIFDATLKRILPVRVEDEDDVLSILNSW